MSPLYILGAGGQGRELAALIAQITAPQPWQLAGFIDDDPNLQDDTIQELPVSGNTAWLIDRARNRRTDHFYVLGIGAPRTRKKLAARLQDSPARPAAICHPTAARHETVHLSPGSILCRNVSPTVSVRIGAHVLINQHCTIGHDAVIEPFAVIHPGVKVSGGVHIGAVAEIGAGAVLLPGVSVGARAVVGAGAVVTVDLPPECTAVGVPARVISNESSN